MQSWQGDKNLYVDLMFGHKSGEDHKSLAFKLLSLCKSRLSVMDLLVWVIDELVEIADCDLQICDHFSMQHESLIKQVVRLCFIFMIYRLARLVRVFEIDFHAKTNKTSRST